MRDVDSARSSDLSKHVQGKRIRETIDAAADIAPFELGDCAAGAYVQQVERGSNRIPGRQYTAEDDESRAGCFAERPRGLRIGAPCPTVDDDRSRHSVQRPSVVEAPRQHVDEAFLPQRKRWSFDVER